MDPSLDITALPADELVELYTDLLRRYNELTALTEADAQKIYELKRSLGTATAAQAFLAQELEQLAGVRSDTETSQKVQHEMGELRRKNAALQQDYDELVDEHAELQREIRTLREVHEKCVPELPTTPLCDETEQQLTQLKQEYMTLLHKLEELREDGVKYTMIIADREKNLEILRDQVFCLEENMRVKREELEEKTELLESAQEQLAEANARIAMLTSTPDNDDRKGNSLFAEVDDQRQAMKQLLAAQKTSYLQMKKSFNESEYEIRRLKRENRAMHTELQTCSSIFLNADKTYRDKLNERVGTLIKQNDELERKVKWTQDRLAELADQKGFGIKSLFKMCKLETDDLKAQLHSVRIQKAALEAQLRSTQQDMARWRFESLRSRCVLQDREGLLNEHKIAFKTHNTFKVSLTEAQQRVAEPQIHYGPLNNTQFNVDIFSAASPTMRTNELFIENKSDSQPIQAHKEDLKEIKPEAVPINENKEYAEAKFPLPTICNDIETTIPTEENKENIKLEQHNSVICIDDDEEPEKDIKKELSQDSSTVETTTAPTPLKNAHGSSLEKLTRAQAKKSPPPSNQLPGPSILCNKRDVFPNDAQKNVHFNQQPAVFLVTPHKTATDGNLRVRPNIVIRRVQVKSKAAKN